MSASFQQKYKFQLIFFLIAFVLYGNTIRNGYALDDEFVAGPKNIAVKGFKAIPKIFTSFHIEDESDNNYEYRPLVKLSFALEYQFFGEHPALSHFINILLYGLCLVLLYKLLLLIFDDLPAFTSFLITIVFAFLPIHAEVVASLKNRDVLLCFVFSMGGFIQLLKYYNDSGLKKLVFSFLLFTLAFLSKYDVLPYTLIVAMVVYQKKKKIVFGGAIVFIFFASLVVYFMMKKSLLNKEDARRVFKYLENPLFFEKSVALKLSAAFNSMGFYIKMLIFPSKMACYYGFNVIPIWSFSSFYALLGISAIPLMLYGFFSRFRKSDMLWYGLLFFGASISMYLNFVKPAPGIVADRFAFFASVGFSMIVVFLLFAKEKNYPTEFKSLKSYQKGSSVVLLCFAVLIINRNGDWKDKLSLFEADTENYPESVKLALLNSSQVIIHLADNSGRIKPNEAARKMKKAEQELVKAIQVDSSCGGCYNNLSYLLLSYESDPRLALKYLMKGFKVDSTKKELVCNIGISYYRLNQFDSAKHFLNRAIKMDVEKSFLIPYDVMMTIYSKSDIKEGLRYFQKVVENQPASEAMNIFLAKLYFQDKDTANSLIYYKKAHDINPANAEVGDFLNNLQKRFYK